MTLGDRGEKCEKDSSSLEDQCAHWIHRMKISCNRPKSVRAEAENGDLNLACTCFFRTRCDCISLVLRNLRSDQRPEAWDVNVSGYSIVPFPSNSAGQSSNSITFCKFQLPYLGYFNCPFGTSIVCYDNQWWASHYATWLVWEKEIEKERSLFLKQNLHLFWLWLTKPDCRVFCSSIKQMH